MSFQSDNNKPSAVRMTMADSNETDSTSDDCSSTNSSSGGDNTPPNQHQHKKSVSFGTVQTFCHEVIEGHPHFECVMPLSLGWRRVKRSKLMSVDQCEKNKRWLERHATGSRGSEQLLRTTVTQRRRMIARSETRVKNALAVQSCAQWVLPKDSHVLAAVGNEDDLYFHGTRLLQSCWSKQHAQRA